MELQAPGHRFCSSVNFHQPSIALYQALVADSHKSGLSKDLLFQLAAIRLCTLPVEIKLYPLCCLNDREVEGKDEMAFKSDNICIKIEFQFRSRSDVLLALFAICNSPRKHFLCQQTHLFSLHLDRWNFRCCGLEQVEQY
jgi:hypothetical protein